MEENKTESIKESVKENELDLYFNNISIEELKESIMKLDEAKRKNIYACALYLLTRPSNKYRHLGRSYYELITDSYLNREMFKKSANLAGYKTKLSPYQGYVLMRREYFIKRIKTLNKYYNRVLKNGKYDGCIIDNPEKRGCFLDLIIDYKNKFQDGFQGNIADYFYIMCAKSFSLDKYDYWKKQ